MGKGLQCRVEDTGKEGWENFTFVRECKGVRGRL